MKKKSFLVFVEEYKCSYSPGVQFFSGDLSATKRHFWSLLLLLNAHTEGNVVNSGDKRER